MTQPLPAADTVPVSLGDLALRTIVDGVSPHGEGSVPGGADVWSQMRGSGEEVIDLSLAEGWTIQAPIRPDSERAVPIVREGDEHLLEWEGRWPVRLAERAEFLAGVTPWGHPRWHLSRTYGTFLILRPITAQKIDGRRTPFIARAEGLPPVEFHENDMLDIVRAALAEGTVDSVAIRFGEQLSTRNIDVVIHPMIQRLKRHFEVNVTVESPVAPDPAALDIIYGVGADAIAMPLWPVGEGGVPIVNLEGEGAVFDSLRHAVTVFPRGTVVCPVAAGVRSPVETAQIMERLAQAGVSPVLDPTALQERGSARDGWDMAALRSAWLHLDRVISGAKLERPWTAHPIAEGCAIPAAAFDTTDAAAVRRRDFWQTKPGQVIIRNLIRLRRRLRVRRVDESFESAEL